MNIRAGILKKITGHYLSSPDFNGLPIRELVQEYKRPADLRKTLASLIREGKISLLFEDVDENPYIKRFPEQASENQIKKLYTSELLHVCAYPSPHELKGLVDSKAYSDRPFTLKLALGEAQLTYESFDLSVL